MTEYCIRCGSKTDSSGEKTFRCKICKDIKIKRELLKPIELKIIENFIKAKTSLYGFSLKELYIFGSYAEKNERCGDIDFLLTYDKNKIYEYIEANMEEYTEFLYDSCYNFEDDQVDSDALINYLERNDFWDFRKCNEYPDCLSCYEHLSYNEDEICAEYHDDFYRELRKKGVHNYCIKKCRSIIKTNFGIPSCCEIQNYCSWDNKDFRNDEISSQILKILANNIKMDADVQFERSGLKVKVIHLNIIESIARFKQANKKANPNFIKLI